MKSTLKSLFLNNPLSFRRISCMLIPVLLLSFSAQAQYFGRNKVNYKNFDFKVLESPHFEMYHYLGDSSANALIQASERWYQMHQKILNDTIEFKNPIIFYNNHADFQQTTAIRGDISVGTGGVTEGLKNRVVMPVMDSWAKTDHVLGHELVHAFQYNILRSEEDSLSLQNIQNLPLWMVEGMAEYMSLGREDAHTAMWMRDAVYNKDIPTLKDLSTNPKYFPYRYGQAFWAFVAGVWGDQMIEPLFKETARYGLEHAVDSLFRTNTENFSKLWAKAMTRHYERLFPDSVEQFVGTKLIHEGNAGAMNLAPMISPDGNALVFISEKKIFSMDMFLADAQTGEIKKSIFSTVRNGHIDDYNYIENGGTWSPDNRYFAFVTISKGKNKLVILDVKKGKTHREFFPKGLQAISNPSWSPDGKQLVVTAQVKGQTDLFLINPQNQSIDRLTNDVYSEIQPNWSPDGERLVFATDRVSLQKGPANGKYTFNLGLLYLKTGLKLDLNIFPGANNLNPVFASQGEEILFLSNRDGFRNLYAYQLEEQKIYQMTRFITGISGVTEFSPAITYSDATQQVIYSHYSKQKYTLYRANLDEFKREEVNPLQTDFRAASLPPSSPQESENLVNHYLTAKDQVPATPEDSIKKVGYRPKFQLDYIGNTGVTMGVSTGRFGTGIAGGVEAMASDILGNNQLFTGISVNGQIYDMGGIFAYLNQSSRFNWGASISHIPILYSPPKRYYKGTFEEDGRTISYTQTVVDRIRYFNDNISIFGYLPISRTFRFEAGISQTWMYIRIDRYYDIREFDPISGTGTRFQETEKIEGLPSYSMQQISAAAVKDNSYFGLVSPLRGERYRIGVEKHFGDFNYSTLLIDYRKYWFLQPVTLAARAYHSGRFGQATDLEELYPISFLYPQNMHGLDLTIFNEELKNETMNMSDFQGEKLFLANFEVRLPFTGPKKLSLIESKMFFTELAFFLDAGVVYSDEILFERVQQEDGSSEFVADVDFKRVFDKKAVFSTGASLRVNFFGQMIIEPYYAIPFTLDKFYKGKFGVNFLPGW